jgi:hypothetical protein
MNWYKNIKLSALEPGAWDQHDTTHRLQRDRPIVQGPFGYSVIQKTRDQKDLQQDYEGVHATTDPQIAMIYANNLARQENDTPIVLEIITTQGWQNDIDASQPQHFAPINDWLENLEYNIEDKINEEGRTEDVIEEIMMDLENIEIYDEREFSSDTSDLLQEQGKQFYPSAIIEYFNHYYGQDAVKYFWKSFLAPVIFGEGLIDDNINGWLINQMRFMSPISHEEISAIYTFEPFSEQLYEEYRDESEYDEEGYKKISHDEIMSGDVGLKEIWRNSKEYLIPEVFATYYHGTILSRAKEALPELTGALG